MRLLYCLRCEDVVRLLPGDDDRHCDCGRSHGRITTGNNTAIGGPCEVLGVTHGQLKRAVQYAPERGEGPRFFAFVMPRNSPSVRRLEHDLSEAV